jgi:hypothetical protein
LNLNKIEYSAKVSRGERATIENGAPDDRI